MEIIFARFARWAENSAGRPTTFVLAIGLIVAWGVSYPFFSSFDTFQLVINTVTTIITFLMVFVIQNSQTRDTRAIQAKLDELIRVNADARNELIKSEELNKSG